MVCLTYLCHFLGLVTLIPALLTSCMWPYARREADQLLLTGTQARRAGAVVGIDRKTAGGSNKAHQGACQWPVSALISFVVQA